MHHGFKLLFGVGMIQVGCLAAPSQHDEVKYHVHTVAFGPSLDADARPWFPNELQTLQEQVKVLWALGPTLLIAPEGDAEFVLRPFNADTPAGRCALGAGRFFPKSRYAECDPGCTDGLMGLRTCLGHEYGHWLGMEHVCLPDDPDGPDCSPVGRDFAMMNRQVDYQSSDGTRTIVAPSHPRTDGDTVSSDHPTTLDLAEFRRVHP